MNLFVFVLPEEKLDSQHLFAAAKALAELGAMMEGKQHQQLGGSLGLPDDDADDAEELVGPVPQEIIDHLNRCYGSGQ